MRKVEAFRPRRTRLQWQAGWNYDATLTERNRGWAERVELGSNPAGSLVRVVLSAMLFVVIFGTIFFLALR